MSTIFILVFLIFLTLKLAAIGQVAEWSWWYVTAPIWSLPAVMGTIVGLTFVGSFLGGAYRKMNRFVEAERRKKEALRETEEFLESD